MNSANSDKFFELFLGNDRAHGVFNVTSDRERDGKKQGFARVIQEKTTLDHWSKHLAGEVGLGIIPIKDNNCCHWGAIDIDTYNINHKDLSLKLKKHGFDAVVCRSKSGGAHVYFFFTEEITALHLHTKLTEISSFLGHAGSEVFPKQTKLLVERGDTGNFINMPYFSGSNTTRYAFDQSGESMDEAEFLALAFSLRVPPNDFMLWKTEGDKVEELLPHGPPCLQHLCSQGFGEGGRNNALFSLGVYARQAHKEKWEEVLQSYNVKYMRPPLGEKEVSVIIKQLQKKEYFYKCDDQPIVSFCNKELCLTRKFGIGPGGKSNDLSGLTKINGDPPIWLLNVDGHRVELSTDALVSQTLFQKECVAQINRFPVAMGASAWQRRMQMLLDAVTVEEVAPDATFKGAFEDLLVSFCCDRAKGEEKEDILQGIAVWHDGKVFFQAKDLHKHLTVNNFLHYSPNKLGLRLNQLGGKKIFWNVNGKGLHAWFFPQPFFNQLHSEAKLKLPPKPKDVSPF